MLNIDALLGEPKVIRYNGKDYKVKDASLLDVVNANKLLKSKKEDDVLVEMSKITKNLVPGFPVDTVPLRVLDAVFKYIMDDIEPAEAEKN